MTTQEIYNELSAPFADDEIEFRPLRIGNSNGRKWALLAPFVQARAIMTRLDDVVGPDCWQDEYKELLTPAGTGCLCRLSVKFGDEWVTKSDGADYTDIEATKGGISDALKRAAVKFGIGRYLYTLDSIFANIQDGDAPKGVRVLKINDKKENIYGWCEIPSLSQKAKLTPAASSGKAKPAGGGAASAPAGAADPAKETPGMDYWQRAEADEAAYLRMFPADQAPDIEEGLVHQKESILREPLHGTPTTKLRASAPGTAKMYCQYLKTAIEARQKEIESEQQAAGGGDDDARAILAEISKLEGKQGRGFKTMEKREEIVGARNLTKVGVGALVKYRDVLRQGAAA